MDPTVWSALIKIHSNSYQTWLIVFGVAVLILTAIFFYREAYPEFRVYQDAYVELEKARGERVKFKKGIKQILYYAEEPGPETIDRCVTCHVAQQLPHFSPTQIARDVNGKIQFNLQGIPVQEPNPDYVFNQIPEDSPLQQMRGVLAMHPLLGSETRPFEFHPIEEYGCTSCHSGNGRSVNAKRAHGPVFDEEYEAAAGNPLNPYVEVDEANDPQISRVFNFKPGHELLFQTTPLLPGPLMEAKCVQCHQPSQHEMEGVVVAADIIQQRKQRQVDNLAASVADDRAAIAALEEMQQLGPEKAHRLYTANLSDPRFTPEERDAFAQRLEWLYKPLEPALKQARGSLAAKEEALATAQGAVKRLDMAKQPFALLLDDHRLVKEVASEAEPMLDDFERGETLFVSQACYGCHRLDGLSRGGIGPDLTEAGLSYPWYIKMSIVWPQGKLPGSAMPNFKLDHEEVGDLMAFLMAQTGDTKALSQMQKAVWLRTWEQGHPAPWERPIAASDLTNVEFAMTVFAEQGCAACHRLQGFEGNVDVVGGEEEWFWRTFPQDISGRELVDRLESKREVIDARIVTNDRTGTLLERLDVAPYNTPFRFAMRAKDAEYAAMRDRALTPTQKAAAEAFIEDWRKRVTRVRTAFIEEYGLGRDIGPRLNWSGVWRDDQWLTGHFLNPTDYSPRSIMPAFPFDSTKFYSLNNMLHVLGKKNRDDLQAVWAAEGFDPALTFEMLCAACHGNNKQGNGPVAEWIYPIPKNLRNAEFLRNLTREEAIESITHGVKGTPMPPWGESVLADGDPVLSGERIELLVNWLYSTLPASPLLDQPKPEKWQYTPESVVAELKNESVSQVFREQVNPKTDQTLYYIREKFYTPANIEAGEQLFQIQCAHCHGTEAAGNGPRAETMIDAKPRMLTNFPWLQSHDDMDLLRSIKFGIPGTAMVAQGDRTDAEQRLQLVMYIRTLSTERQRRFDLQDALYNRFDIEVIKTLQEGGTMEQVTVIRDRRRMVEQLGEAMIAKDVSDGVFDNTLAWIRTGDGEKLAQAVRDLDAAIEGLEQRRIAAAGRIRSGERDVQLQELTAEQGGLINLKTQILSTERQLKNE